MIKVRRSGLHPRNTSWLEWNWPGDYQPLQPFSSEESVTYVTSGRFVSQGVPASPRAGGVGPFDRHHVTSITRLLVFRTMVLFLLLLGVGVTVDGLSGTMSGFTFEGISSEVSVSGISSILAL